MDTKNKTIIVNGIITKVESIKEFDKKLTLVTSELGKINVISFGTRRQNSKNISKTNIFVVGEFELKIIKGIYNLNSVKVKKYFTDLSKNVDNFIYGNYFLELLNYFSFENNPDFKILDLMINSLDSLIKDKMNKTLIRRVFELRLLAIQGIAKTADLLPQTTTETVKYTWNYVLNSDINKLFNFNLDDIYLKEFEFLVKKELDINVDYKFNSLDLI